MWLQSSITNACSPGLRSQKCFCSIFTLCYSLVLSRYKNNENQRCAPSTCLPSLLHQRIFQYRWSLPTLFAVLPPTLSIVSTVLWPKFNLSLVHHAAIRLWPEFWYILGSDGQTGKTSFDLMYMYPQTPWPLTDCAKWRQIVIRTILLHLNLVWL